MITVQLEATDLGEAFKLHKRWGIKWWLLYCLYTGVFAGFGIWLIVYSSVLATWGIIILAYAALLWVFLGYFKIVLIPKIAQKSFRRQKELQRPYTLSWNEETFMRESQTVTSNTPWSDFMKWRNNENLFLVYLTGRSFRIVPTRFFKDEQAMISFSKLLHEKIGPSS